MASKVTKPAHKSPKSGSSGWSKEFKPRPARPVEERLPKLYHGLTDQVDGGHFKNAINTCKKILSLDPTALPAFQTLLFLHLQIDDYAAALALLEQPPSGSGGLDFERAYCLYRLHKEKEALEQLQKTGTRGRKEEHLEAQIRYRLGDYEQSQQIYDDLLAGCDPSSSEHPDILTNLEATASHSSFIQHDYHSHLSAPPITQAGGSAGHVPTEADLETFVPSLPIGWATGGVGSVVKKTPPKEVKARKRPRHKLPKGVVEGRAFTEDPDRWLPMKQRASYMAAQSKKKGANQSMGVGMTQGSTQGGGGGTAGGGSGGGNKKKKGKK